MLQSVTECNRVTQSSTEYYRVLQSSTEYYRVVQSITEYNRVLQSNTKYYKEESSASTWTNFRGLLFLNLAKIHTSIPRYQGGGSIVQGIFLENIVLPLPWLKERIGNFDIFGLNISHWRGQSICPSRPLERVPCSWRLP